MCVQLNWGFRYYRVTGKDGKEGPLRCRRSTSQIEALHYHLRRLLHNAHNISQVKAVLLLAEYLTRWNTRQAARSLGEPAYGWYDFTMMEGIVELAAKCEVTEYPYLRLTTEYQFNPDHVFYVWPGEVDSDAESDEDDTDDELDGDGDGDGDNIVMMTSNEPEEEVGLDDEEQAETDRECRIREAVEKIVRSTDKPLTRMEAAKLGVDPTPAAATTPSKVNPSGGVVLVVPGSMTIYEWRLMHLMEGKGYVAPSKTQGAAQYAKEWNLHAERAIMQGSNDGVHYELRKLNSNLAVNIYAIQTETANARATLRPLYTVLKELQAKFTARNAARTDYGRVVVEAPEVREEMMVESTPGKLPPSSAPVSKEKKTRAPARCRECGHVRHGKIATACGTLRYHCHKVGQSKQPCRLPEDHHATVAATGHASHVYKKDPALDLTQDPTVFRSSWVKSKYGCQYCVLQVHHPNFPEPEPEPGSDAEPEVAPMDVSTEAFD